MSLPLVDLLSGSEVSLFWKGLLRMLSMANELENLVPELVSLLDLLVLEDVWAEEEDGEEGGRTSMLDDATDPWLAADDGVNEWC